MTQTPSDIVVRLRARAQSASETSKMMAQAKSLRQEGHEPPRDDLYMWATPEQTLEWQAADLIEQLASEIAALREVIPELMTIIDMGVTVHLSDAELRSAHPEDRRFIKRTRRALDAATAALRDSQP